MIEDIHQSVLLHEAVAALQPRTGGLYVDGNLGLGGHTHEILARSAPDGRVVAFEWDSAALAFARDRLRNFGSRLQYVHDNFASLTARLAEMGIGTVDGLLLDLGLSSYQLDSSELGFSFRGSQPLDMRMDGRRRLNAAKLLATATEAELADIFYYYGEEKQARRIASFVVEARKSQKLERTDQLVRVVEQAVPKRFQPKKIHVATKVFQALRIAVNGELDNLASVLEQGPGLLTAGGRFCVISFHSLEDRLVKRFFQNNPQLEVVTKRPILPSVEEVQRNPRARSAKLRVAQKVEGV